MKRTEVYSRFYEWAEREGSHGSTYAEENREDDIDQGLSGICFHIGRDANPTTHSIEKEKYLFYENRRSVIPSVITTPATTSCQCFISVDKDNFNKQTPKDSYCRRVSIEIMPENAETPKELTDLLTSKGFEKVKG